MSIRRARSPDSILEEQGRDLDGPGDSNSDTDERPYSPPPPARQTSIRLSRRSDNGGQVRISAVRPGARAESSGRRQAVAQSASGRRHRAPTPIVRRTTRATLTTNRHPSATSDDYDQNQLERNQERRRGQLVVETRGLNRSRQQSADGLTWYERLMPDFVLNMTAPITGYESRPESDVEEEEYEILERQRLKRNRRVRRRLLGLILVGAAVGAFMYSRGKMCQKMGVKAAISQVRHRMEDGLSKSIQDTMGK